MKRIHLKLILSDLLWLTPEKQWKLFYILFYYINIVLCYYTKREINNILKELELWHIEIKLMLLLMVIMICTVIT